MSIWGVKFQTLSPKLRTLLRTIPLKTVCRISNFQFVLVFLKHKGIWGLGVKFQTSTFPNPPRECSQEIFRKLMGTCLQRYYCGVSSPCVLLVATRFCNFSSSPQVVVSSRLRVGRELGRSSIGCLRGWLVGSTTAPVSSLILSGSVKAGLPQSSMPIRTPQVPLLRELLQLWIRSAAGQ